MTRNARRSLALAAAVVALLGAGLAWRTWGSGRVTLEGKLREGSLRCIDACHFELVLEGEPEVTVRADTCIMPDTLRDWPGRAVHVLAAGRWEGPARLHASSLFTREGYWQGQKPSGGRPEACFIPAASP